MKIYNDIRLADPFLLPNWRQERVLHLMSSVPPGRCTRWDDEWILAYRKFFVDYRKGGTARDDLLRASPGLYFAQQIHERRFSVPEMTLMLQARLLTGGDDSELAQKFKTIPETIFWYEKIFFNVRDFLLHTDWIVRSVLLPASDRYVATTQELAAQRRVQDRLPPAIMSPHFDLSLKYFSYFGGELICNYMIHGFCERRPITDPEEAADFFDNFFMMQIRKRSAHAVRSFEINKYNVMQLFTTHAQLLEIQRNSKDTESRNTATEIALESLISAVNFSVGSVSHDFDVHPGIEVDSDMVMQRRLGQPMSDFHEKNKESVFDIRGAASAEQSKSE